jgi:hypothetical protein
MRSIIARIACPALALAATGCHGQQTSAQLAAKINVDMTDVAGFVLTQGAAQTAGANLQPLGTGSSSGGGATELYALGKDGTLTVVTVTGGGTQTTDAQPVAVFDTTSYAIVAYHGVWHGDTQCNFVAARKADGALYCIPASSAEVASPPPGSAPLVQSDATGDLVWINHGDGIALVNLTNPDAVTQTTPVGSDGLTPNGPPEGPFSLAVNAAGDALVADGYNANQYTRVLFPTGGFLDVSDVDESCLTAASAANPDDFYYTTDGPSGLDMLAASSGSFASAIIETTPLFTCGAGIAKVSPHVYMSADAHSSQPNQILDIVGSTATTLTVAALATMTQINGCDASLFVLGTDARGDGGLVRYDTDGGTFTTLLAPGAYALTTMSVAPTCDVTFYGQRAADGAFILGTIAAGSDAVTVNATGFPTVTQIARIN